VGASTAERRLEHALGLAFRYLDRRDRTVAEMEAQLRRRDVDDATAELAIAKLLEDGYLDDARFARRFAEDRRRLDGWGSERIAQRLVTLGLDRDLIEAAVARHDQHEELDAALAVLTRRYAEPPEDARAQSRMLGVLLRKGYDVELAHDALRAFARRFATD
jgi:regulatory protein